MIHHDLLVIGAGSGGEVTDAFPDRDVAIVEHDKFGGTCLNGGCIPTKMFVHTADVADQVRGAGTFDLRARLDAVGWAGIRERVFGRLDAAADQGRTESVERPGLTVYSGHARFVGDRTVRVALSDGSRTDTVTANQVVIAAGGRPMVPEPIASAGVPFETSDTVLRCSAPPRRLAILGGGYIAAELAHVFSALGSTIVMIDMADSLLAPQDETLAERYTDLARQSYDVRLGRTVTQISGDGSADGADGIRLVLDDGSLVEADCLLVAVGRVPNSDLLDLDVAGVETHDDGRIAVDEHQRTTAPGVWALGDISTSVPLKHVANREARVVAHNLAHPGDLDSIDLDAVPAAIFVNPQIATVGRTEQGCRDDDLDHVVSITPFSDTAYGWALQDTSGLCKVIAERGTGRLLGAHLMGPQAATLIQPLVIAMSLGIDVTTLARSPFWIHPAMTEVVEKALLGLEV